MNFSDYNNNNNNNDNYNNYDSNINYPRKIDVVDALKNVGCDGGIMLEPRIQEYLKKKKFYKENGIDPCVSLEKEFQITHRDKKIIKAFLRGKRDMYNHDNMMFNDGKKQTYKKKKQYFPSKAFRDNDPRVQVLNKPDNTLPINRGMFVPDGPNAFVYEDEPTNTDPILDPRDFTDNARATLNTRFCDMGSNTVSLNTGTGWSFDDTRFDPRTDPKMYPGREKYDKHSSQYRIDPNNGKTNDPDPRNKYIISNLKKKNTEHIYDQAHINNTGMCYDTMDKPKDFNLINSDINDVLDNGKRYGEFAAPKFSEQSDIDYDNKMFIPNISSKSNNLNTSSYMTMPFFGPNKDMRDAQLETNLIRGMPSNATRKSFGYRNPHENYYQYLDNDFCNTTEEWPRGGDSTRRDNKSVARKKYVRDFSQIAN